MSNPTAKRSVARAAPVWPVLPACGPGRRIGLLGGSFNPPHEGHRLISLLALKRLQLDAVWWLVTPGNPLKDPTALQPISERIARALAVAGNPRIKVTSIEADVGVSRTRDTLRYLRRRCPTARFVWLMGADNLESFHRWHAWQEIARLAPVAVIDRPGHTMRASAGQAAAWLSPYRIDESDAGLLANLMPPAWVFLHGPRSPLSSTELRRTAQDKMSGEAY